MQKESNTPPWEGGSGGLLEIIDMLCSVTEKMSCIVRSQAELIGQMGAETSVINDLQEAKDSADKMLDRIEYRMRHT